MIEKSKYRFLLIPPFRLPEKSNFNVSITGVPIDLPKEKRPMNSDLILPHLVDVEWDLHPGELATYGDWPVETREEFTYAAAARLPNIRTACESGKYNAIILLGGGEPGFAEAREIARSYGVVVTANAFSQLHLATMLGNKFTVLDVTGVHNMYYRDVIIAHQLQHRCASIRHVGFHLPRPGNEDCPQLGAEREKARAESLHRRPRMPSSRLILLSSKTALRLLHWVALEFSGSNLSLRKDSKKGGGMSPF